MRLNPFPTPACVAALLLLTVTATVAQVAQISGTVTLKKADGSVAPVPDARVDIYRTDIKQKFETTTDQRGHYKQAGLPFVGTYTIAVSAPGGRPDFHAGVRLAQQPVQDFVLMPGDGSRLTPEQIKPMPAAPAAESPEARAAREEREKKNKEIEEKNGEITHANEVVARTFRAGNEALNAGRVEEAIVQYREGLSARPDEPALLTNLSEALRRRGVDRYNAAIKERDSNKKNGGLEAGKKDWSEATQLAHKALEILKSASATDPAQQKIYAQNRRAALSGYAQAMRLVAMKVDSSQARAAWEAYQECIAVETDTARKTKLRGEALQMLLDAGAVDLAAAEARKMLAAEPGNVTANMVLGLSLFASGDKKNFQEAADHLQRYVDLAPDTDPLKQSARESLNYLKTAENIQPRTK